MARVARVSASLASVLGSVMVAMAALNGSPSTVQAQAPSIGASLYSERCAVCHGGDARYATDPALPFFLERYAQAYRNELESFVAGVLDGKPLTPSGDDGLRAQVLADAATKSAKTGESVRVGI